MNIHIKALSIAVAILLAATVFSIVKVEQSISAVQSSRYDAAYTTCIDTNARHGKTIAFVNKQLKKQGQSKTIVESWDRFIQDLVPQRDCADFAQSIVSKK